MSRPSFSSIFMGLAVSLSQRSTCRRLKVGCSIVSPDFRKVIAMGYNGNASGAGNDCDRHGPEAVGNCGCLHAEENAVINCDVPRYTEKIVFCTNLPCIMCAKRLINLGGVREVFYLHDYRKHDAIDLLTSQRIYVTHMKGEAEVDDVQTRKQGESHPRNASDQDVQVLEGHATEVHEPEKR